MSDRFQALIDKYRTRMRVPRETFERDGCLYAVSARNPSYAILLSPNGGSEAAWRVTPFNGREPIGHREYDMLEGGSPIQNGLSEFASSNFVLSSRLRNPIRKRDRDRKIKEVKEAEAAIEVCAGAISRAPDDLARSVFERSQRIWQRQLDALEF